MLAVLSMQNQPQILSSEAIHTSYPKGKLAFKLQGDNMCHPCHNQCILQYPIAVHYNGHFSFELVLFLYADSTGGPLDGPTLEDLERRKSAMSGSDLSPATYLSKLAREKSETAELRPEMFTIYKDEERKARGVEMITRDRTYDPQKEDSGYKPTVSTWGVFPRPANISQAYGGGRTIRPGDVRLAYLKPFRMSRSSL